MTIKHNRNSGKTTITLNWVETKQFITLKSVQDAVAKDVLNLCVGSFQGEKEISSELVSDLGRPDKA